MNRIQQHGTSLAYGRATGEEDIKAMMAILSRAFHFNARDGERYHQRVGPANFRAVRDGATIVGGLAIIHMGQFFGGKRLPMAGIAAVGIAPWMRGKGVARTLMTETLRELRKDYPISALYPATQTLYRAVGYELAGSQFDITVPLDRINLKANELLVRPATADDEPAIEALYRSFAAPHPGNLDRNDVMWHRIRSPRGKTADGFIVMNGSTLEGYVYFMQKNARNKPYSLRITDIAATTPAAARRLLAFLADHRSVGEEAIWSGSPAGPIIAALPENAWKIALHMHWMVRVLDVKAALEQRGYAPCVAGTVELEIEDDILPENAGRWTLSVKNGKATVTQGGAGTMRMNVRALAPLFTGFMSARDLATAGWIVSSDEAALAIADGVFAGPMPFMGDGF